MKKAGKIVLAGLAALAAVGVAETMKKKKQDKEEDFTDDFRRDTDTAWKQPEAPAKQAAPVSAEEKAKADRMQKVKDLDKDPFCHLFDELCK